MNARVGDVLGAGAERAADVADLARALTTLRVGLELLDGWEAGALSEVDARRLLPCLTETTERLTALSGTLAAETSPARP